MLKKLMVMLGGRTGGLIASAIEIVIGVLLLINPEGFTRSIVVALGVLLCLMGIFNMVRYFRRPVQVLGGDWALSRGLLMTLAGVFCVCNSQWLLAILPALFMLYGILLLVAGIFKFQRMTDLKRMKHPRWYMPGLAALLYVVLAVIILLNPFGTAMMVWTFVGVSMIVSAVLDIVTLILAA
ncbi:MAG: HdeD family acid-resistance protein [Aristaeellaceae bacterium]